MLYKSSKNGAVLEVPLITFLDSTFLFFAFHRARNVTDNNNQIEQKMVNLKMLNTT